jgi:hypothetical protein
MTDRKWRELLLLGAFINYRSKSQERRDRSWFFLMMWAFYGGKPSEATREFGEVV